MAALDRIIKGRSTSRFPVDQAARLHVDALRALDDALLDSYTEDDDDVEDDEDVEMVL
jgi:hypothetical protein